MTKLENKVTVVTGGNSGIGLATAKLFAVQGAKVAVFGREADTLENAKSSIDGECITVNGDVRNMQDLDDLFSKTHQQWGSIDTVVVNAGWGEVLPFVDTTEESFDTQCDTNFKGTFFTIQKALPFLKDGGSIILISSIAGFKGLMGMSAYSASKAAVRSLARTLTAELAPRKIRVNVISPGAIDTPAFGRMPGLQREALAMFKDITPLGRPGLPTEIANTALFLASDDASFVAGADFAVDGGWAQV